MFDQYGLSKNKRPFGICMKISILISCHNEEKNINRCFESIQNQTFQDFEIVCVDDASKDNTLEKLKEWQEIFGTDKFVLIVNSENLGLTKSLNVALSRARGEYIARIDADDFWEKDKLKKQARFMDSHPECGIIGTNHVNIYENNPSKKYVRLPETHEMIAKKLFRRNPFAHSCVMARTDLIRKVGGYDESIRYGQDYDLWLRCFPLTRFHNIQEFLCARRIDGASTKKQKPQMLQSIKTRVKYIRKYKYGWKNYFYLIEPLMVAIAPDFIKNLKRKHL